MGELDDSIGTLFIGLLVSVALWGLSCSQAWNYFRDYPKDLWIIKLIVCIAFIADTIHQALIAHTLYIMLITDFADPFDLLFIPKSLLVSVPFFEATSLAVQGFFTYRIWKLSGRSWIWTGLTIALIMAKLVSAIVYTVQSMRIHFFVELNTKLQHVMVNYVAVDLVTDVVITGIMCWLLYASKTEYRHTNSILNRLIFFTTTTGSLTGLMAAAGLAARVTWPYSFGYFPLYFAIGRLYVNSLLAALNMRVHLRRTAVTDVELVPQEESPRSSRRARRKGLEIKVAAGQENQWASHLQNPKHVYLGGGRG